MHKKRQKPKNLKAALSNLFSYCKKEAGIILFALIMAALGAVLTMAGPNQISKITDYIYNGLTGGISTEAVLRSHVDSYLHTPSQSPLESIKPYNSSSEVSCVTI